MLMKMQNERVADMKPSDGGGSIRESLMENGLPIPSHQVSTLPTDHIHHNQFLRMETCVLKVNVDCHGCRQKVKKILNKIEGVFTVSIEADQQRVIVKGTADPETLIKRLIRSGKHAELGSSKSLLQNPDQEQMHPDKLNKKNKNPMLHQNSTSGEADSTDQLMNLNLQEGGESGYNWGYQELADPKNHLQSIIGDGSYKYGIDDMIGIHGHAHHNGYDAATFVGLGGDNSNIQRFQDFSAGSPAYGYHQVQHPSPLLMENMFHSEYNQNPYARWLRANAQNNRNHDGYMQFHHQY